MPGVFSKDNRPLRTGAYTNFVSVPVTAIAPSIGSVVALPVTHTWGPFKVATLCTSYGDYLAKFRDPHRDVRFAFQGEDFGGRGGAGAVIVYRYGTSAAAKASRSMLNATVAALTVTALYEGTTGNLLTTQDNANADGSRDFVVSLGGVEVERYNHGAADLAGLAAQINLVSRWIRAVVVADGVALATTSGALAGGNDGATAITGAEHTAIQGALEFERFGIFTLSDPTAAFHTSYKTWIQNRNKTGQRFVAVFGGPLGEVVSGANTRSLGFNEPHILNLGGFGVTDEVDGLLSPAQLAPRIAGVLAARGRNRSLSMARLRGLTLTTPATSADVDTAYANGTIVLARDSNPQAQVYIEKGLTTFTSKADPLRPYRIYRNPKFMLTMCVFESELTEYAQSPGIIGELGVNDKTRTAIVGDATARLSAMEAANIVQGGWTVGVDANPPPSNDDEFVALSYSLRFMRTVEQVYNTVVVA